MTYIQGIRGIAILLIILFHLLPDWCPNGYMGVDVFFIISGYFLVGRQLVSDDTFKPWPFVKKKGVRLLVPYLGVIVLVGLVSMVVFPAHAMLESCMLKPCILAQGNVFLSRLGNNYFSSNTRNFPLMHLWYMGVLLQSYLFFMCLFMGWSFLRCGRRTRVAIISLIGLISFAVAFLWRWQIPYDYARDTYYWTSSRLWEFSLGGLLYLLPKARPGVLSQSAAIAALMGLVSFSFIVLPNSSVGILIGAVCGSLLLRYGVVWEKYSPLCCQSVVWVGGVSFSLYLLHWPCICFAEFMLCGPLSPVWALALCAVILPLSLFYKMGVEDSEASLRVVPILWLLAAVVWGVTVKTDGLKNYLHKEVNALLENPVTAGRPSPVDAASPLYGGTEGIRPNQGSPYTKAGPLLYHVGDSKEAPTFVILGDSHADDFSFAMHALGLQNGWHGIYLNAYVTPFWNSEYCASPHTAPGHYFNQDKAWRILHWLSCHQELKTVFIAQSWQGRLQTHYSWSGKEVAGNPESTRAAELKEFCKHVQAVGKRVVVVTDPPRIGTDFPKRMVEGCLMWHNDGYVPDVLKCDKNSYEKHNGALNRAMDCMAEEGLCLVLHREKAFYETDIYQAFDGRILYHQDSNHLTPAGSLRSVSKDIEYIRSILQDK